MAEGDEKAPAAVVVVLMGVSGSGKTTVAGILSEMLHWDFEEGDALHPESNVRKMAAGHALTDDDRWPWLDLVEGWIADQLARGRSGVITCSALKRSYRDVLRRAGAGVRIAYLRGDEALISDRQTARQGHFMPPSLMRSQFETLETPEPDENVVTFDVGAAPREIAREIIREMDLVAG